MALQEELQQTTPFPSLETEAALSVVRTAGKLGQGLSETLRPFGLTPTQYNVLRILRGAGEAGLCRYEVIDRMVTPVPDATRLLDRLEEGGFVARARDASDRRHVKARITHEGLHILAELDDVLLSLHASQLGHLGRGKLETLIGLLDEVRART